ncbi:MAG: hypothetical protein NT086_08025 [Proteobacteria bacterium]|nr:hypothetical protein [Pseudomonadota bacterium]
MNNLLDLRQAVTVTHSMANAHLAADDYTPTAATDMYVSIAVQLAFECLQGEKHPQDCYFQTLLALDYLQPVMALIKEANHA